MIFLRMAFDDIVSQFKRFVLSTLLIVICLVVLIFVIVTYKGQNYAYLSADEMLNDGFGNTGILSVNEAEDSNDKMLGFINEANKRKEIACIGDMCLYGMKIFPELYEIQSKGKDCYFSVYEGCTTILTINSNIFELCELELGKGNYPSELDFSDKKVSYLYLGSAYSSIPIGTKYNNESDITYIVAGIMKDGQRWIDPKLIDGISNQDLDYTIDCTYAVIEIQNSRVSTNGMWITANDGYSIEEAIEAAYEIGDKYGLKIRYATMKNRYEESCSDTLLLMSYLGKAFGIILPAIILMMIVMQIVSIMLQLHDYGIMCSMGFSIKEINIILIIKNFVMSILAFVIAVPIVLKIESTWFDEEIQYIIKTVMINDALPWSIGILLVTIIVTSITSVTVMGKYTPVQLMRKCN